MPDTPIRVEVVCGRCGGTGRDPHIGTGGTNQTPIQARCATSYGGCGGSGVQDHLAVPGSLTEAMMQLAQAAYARGPFFGKVVVADLAFNTAIAKVQALIEADPAALATLTGEG